MTPRQTKITLAEMCISGVHGLLIYCADNKCSHHIRISADQRPDETRLCALPPVPTTCLHDLAVCQKCKNTGARPVARLPQLTQRLRHQASD